MSKFGKVLMVIMGILMILSGIVCLFNPGYTYLMVGYVVGFAMVFDAVGRIAAWWELRNTPEASGWLLAGGILSMVLGFFLLNSAALQLGVDAFIVYYVAIWLVILGIMVICRAWKLRKFHKEWDTKMLGSHWYLPLILGILMIAFGVFCLFKPLVMASTLGIFIGLGVVSTGANMITMATMVPTVSRK